MSRGAVYMAALAAVPLVAGCAGGFRRLQPGMTTSQVVEAMRREPTRTEQFEQGYAAWYYGEDSCLLLKEDTVVSMQESEAAETVLTPVGMVDERVLAQCLPPGVERPQRRAVRVQPPMGNIPMQQWGGRVGLRGAGTP
jgi:hypothetical protein